MLAQHKSLNWISVQIRIKSEADNGWVDVNGYYSSTYFTPSDKNQLFGGTGSPYYYFSPAQPYADSSTTTYVAHGGNYEDGTASSTIEYLHGGGTFEGSRVHFELFSVGQSGGPDEPDLARLNSGSNIDRGINMTSGWDDVAGSSRDQFLEVLPSEDQEGGLQVSFAGFHSGDQPFSNPVTAFGFYLMGREIKRDVILDVYDTQGNLIYSDVTLEPENQGQAVVEYISFALDPDLDVYPIESFMLREQYNSSTDTGGRRDIFSIDNLTLQFGDLYVSDPDGDGDGDDQFDEDAITIYVDGGSQTAPYFNFFQDESGATPIEFRTLDIDQNYTFKRLAVEAPSHNSITSEAEFRTLISLYASSIGQSASFTVVTPFDSSFTNGVQATVGAESFEWNVAGHGADPAAGTGPHATRDGGGLSFTDDELAAMRTTNPFYISDRGVGESASRNIFLAGDGSRNAGIVGDQSFTLGFSEDADPVNTPVISAFSTLNSSIATKFAVVDGDFEPYIVDTLNSDAIYATTRGWVRSKFYILPDNDKQNTIAKFGTVGGRSISPSAGTYWQEADFEGYLPSLTDVQAGISWQLRNFLSRIAMVVALMKWWLREKLHCG